MNYVRSNNLSLKYHKFTSSGCKDIGIRKFEFVAKTQFLTVKVWGQTTEKIDLKFLFVVFWNCINS